ncbi:hypothetical protein M885DRAFT_518555 [Pelagophyceae sp. CCMP2097]|nr:hypothetical protein M885DRAFT_518555 [Pelagophyceae sp. CCMP2097]
MSVVVKVAEMPCSSAKWLATSTRPRWRVPIALGLVFSSWVLVASVIGILQELQDERNKLERQRAACRDASDVISEWGKRLAVEASTLGWLMVRERSVAETVMPFLVPGMLSRALQLERLKRMAREFDQTPPLVVWYPTVLDADRAVYEAYAADQYNKTAPLVITDESEANAMPSLRVFNAVPAPRRPSYNPVTFVWTTGDVGDAVRTDLVDQILGTDARWRYENTFPKALQQRFFEERSLVAFPAYLANGEPYADFTLTVIIPVYDERCYVHGKCATDPRTAASSTKHQTRDERGPPAEPPVLDGSPAPVLGYVSFTLFGDKWLNVFPENLRVIGGATGHVIKTAQVYDHHTHTHEAVLDLDLECGHNISRHMFWLYFGAAISPAAIFFMLLVLRRLEVDALRQRRLEDEELREMAAQKQRIEERIQYGFAMSKKTERYLNHELKNRIIILGQTCAEQSLQVQIEEITEVLNNKAALMRLSTGRYTPSWGAADPSQLVGLRWQRHVAANSPFDISDVSGLAAHRTTLRLDGILFNIILDNMLSNAFKYGDASRPPALSLRVEPLDEGSTRVRLSLELRNWAGPEHATLLEMGEDTLNEIALREGARAHEHAAELSSGDGFPMAAAAASALGGTVKLFLLNDCVLAKLTLPDVAAVLPVAVPALPAPVDLAWLKVAMADDSATFRKTFARLARKVTSREPGLAGETRESIDDFTRMVVEGDVDFLFLDFNFAPVHHTKTGVDLCRECRALDAEEGNVPRVIFIVSANDSPEDAELYRDAGADGSLGKKMTVGKLRQVLEDAVRTHPRFAGRRGEDAPLAGFAGPPPLHLQLA